MKETFFTFEPFVKISFLLSVLQCMSLEDQTESQEQNVNLNLLLTVNFLL